MANPIRTTTAGDSQTEPIRSPPPPDPVSFGGKDDGAPRPAVDGLLGWGSALEGSGLDAHAAERLRPLGLVPATPPQPEPLKCSPR